MVDPGIDGRGVREGGLGGLPPQVYLQLVMQWQIQELTEGGAKEGSGGLAPRYI